VPPELELRYTVYPVAPGTAVQLTVILVDEAAVAVTPVGVAGAVPDAGPTITYADLVPSPTLFTADTWK
jgi:hypothetical protein